ncbi:helix-turn-helix domain-containing protein [Pseudoponticoccus marisrubri]|uniref:HTH crp-type domain-containing protein n=1 Tax=Pseudoponticoccus marisrubri TaxID=1685382 RepID=A0A0W7WJX9_9RHOB|nr:helix-turn-helix domain-containing protein [Pseudoponticoccus marisrubri]KUF10807.1 hypothetical protein AVJ23_10225 [Pseudoponticoccus marisrubri]
MPMRNTRQGAFIRDHFQTIWPAHLEGFTHLLVQLRARFDGDLDLVLVLAVIASRTQSAQWAPQLAELDRLTHGEEDDTPLPINIQSVADYSGIPRETVRRKVALLQEKGWVARRPGGRLSVTRDAATDLQDGTGDTIAYLAALLKVVEAAQGKAPESGPRHEPPGR